MNANVSFRHMESSASLREYAVSKLERIVNKYVQGKVDATVVMSVEKHWHIADFTLHIKSFTVKGKQRSEDMYSSIDLALEKIEKQLRRHKDRLKDHQPKKNGHARSRMFRMGVVSSLDGPGIQEDSEFDEEFAEDYELYPAPSEEAEAVANDGGTRVVEVQNGDTVKVLRNQEYEARPMSLKEAVLQLDLLSDREFYVFTNTDSNDINIVYKRNDGNVGLIETA